MEDGIFNRVTQLYKIVSNGKTRFYTEFGEMIGSNGKTIGQQLKGERAISLDTVMNILNTFPEISSDWLLRGIGEMKVSDNLPPFHGEETDRELELHAELARKVAELEEYKLRVLRLEAQKDYLQQRNDELVISNRLLQDELSNHQ